MVHFMVSFIKTQIFSSSSHLKCFGYLTFSRLILWKSNLDNHYKKKLFWYVLKLQTTNQSKYHTFFRKNAQNIAINIGLKLKYYQDLIHLNFSLIILRVFLVEDMFRYLQNLLFWSFQALIILYNVPSLNYSELLSVSSINWVMIAS